MAKDVDPEEATRRAHDDAFAAFRRETEAQMRTIAFGRLGADRKRTDDPQIAVDKAYEQLRAKWETIEERERMPLIITIVTRRAIDLARRRKSTVNIPDTQPAEDNPLRDLEEREDDRLDVARIHDLMPRLKPRHREAVERIYLGGETAADIAADWGVTDTAVNQNKRAGLAHLRRLLGVPEPDEPERRGHDEQNEGT